MTHNILELIGNTPMIKLSRFNPHFNFNLYVKCEFTNPTLSIKDRIVLSMIRAFEAQNKLKPGDTILEASSGNTGSSLAMIAAVLGYKAIITVPAKTSSEKVNTMRALGADVIICDPSPPDSPEHYTNKAGILAKTIDNGVFLGQYENPVNVETHYRETAVEIWEQMEGNIDYLLAASSSGGTITGIAKFLKEKNSSIKIIMPDPKGSIFYPTFHKIPGKIEASAYKIEGAGKDKICPIHDFSLIDDALQFTDDEAFETAKKLAQTEGLLVGGSAGGALSVLEQLNQRIKPSANKPNVVVVLADSGFKYLSKNFS
ncbi:MAG: cysteine synthase family protein [Gammaproteobacteria bacterium]|nr:cysteine synthase family protein [Gammaproteobacteria bacterium]